jgi:hypothetical protein
MIFSDAWRIQKPTSASSCVLTRPNVRRVLFHELIPCVSARLGPRLGPTRDNLALVICKLLI